jgi:RNA polymerase sigma-70 factor, ECF subfamily
LAKTWLTPLQTAELVGAAKRGVTDAFALLYRNYLPLVHSILLGRFSVDCADELSQDCFLIAYQRLHQLQDAQKFAAWLAMIARRMPAKLVPARQRVDDPLLDELQSGLLSPEDAAESQLLLHAIRRLPEHFRETLLLRFVEGMTSEEISEITGLTSQSVRVNLSRGMERLRAELGAPTRALSIHPVVGSQQ